jgi:chromosomal replication initiator protein
MNSFEDVFARVKEYCLTEGGLSEVAVKLWIGSLKPVTLSGSVAAFTVQSDFQRNIVLQNYEELLKQAFEATLGFPVELVIQVVEPTDDDLIGGSDAAPKNADDIDKRHASLEKSLEGANYEYTFSTFIV